MDIKTRNATHKDYRFCYTVTKKNMAASVEKYWGKWDPKVFRENFHLEEIKIILNNNRRIGYFATKLRQNCYYVDNVQISKSMQSKGIGTNIMNLIEKQALQSRDRIQLTVFKDNPAVDLYARLGYKVLNDRGDSLSMVKKLK